MIFIVDDKQENLDAAIDAVKEIFGEVAVISADDFSPANRQENQVVITAKNYDTAKKFLQCQSWKNPTLKFALLDRNFPRADGEPEPLGDYLMCDIAYSFTPCAMVTGGYDHGERVMTFLYYMLNKPVKHLGQVGILKKEKEDYLRCFQMLAELTERQWGWQCPEFSEKVRTWAKDR